MIWIIITILIGLLIWQMLLIKKHKVSIEGFELLLTSFIEVNQQFYEGQKNVAKKDKEILDGLVRQTAELSILRKYSTQIENGLRNTNDAIKNLKDTQKEIKATTEEMVVSKDLATALVNASNNIKLLDKLAVGLKESVEQLKRGK